MRIIALILSFSLFFNCKEEKKSFSRKNKTQDSTDYFVEFNPLDSLEAKRKTGEITNYFNKLVNVNDFSGSFLVAKNGQILFENYQGFAYIEKDKKITKNTPLHLASVSKTLTATAILRLQEQKKLNLDLPLNTYLLGFFNKDITVRMLLNHRSGLRHYGYFLERDIKWDKKKRITNQEILTILNTGKIKLETKPGTRFSYCNTNYVLLALVIEKVTGKKYDVAMEELIFKPLGMKNTFVFDYQKHHDTISQSYKRNKTRLAFDHLDLVYGDKNIYSTPRDLLKFDLATYSDKFLSKASKKEIYKGYSYETKGEKNYGLGVRLREWKEAPTLTYHNGWWHGNTSSFIFIKPDTLTIIAISNKMTHKTYQTKKFLRLFGDYPVKLDETEVGGANE
jgi:CubicO group peptidase (beta-lactamase class C family)